MHLDPFCRGISCQNLTRTNKREPRPSLGSATSGIFLNHIKRRAYPVLDPRNFSILCLSHFLRVQYWKIAPGCIIGLTSHLLYYLIQKLIHTSIYSYFANSVPVIPICLNTGGAPWMYIPQRASSVSPTRQRSVFLVVLGESGRIEGASA
ncbi:hypothetical protein F5Y05DRAFT_368164 [Hypoxylon sp. FL0543]|nr:hypothetical protein F5Y05DRAFT_368164 [Hypoxylon sp. FL0543]